MSDRPDAPTDQATRAAGLPSDAEFRSAFTAYLEWGTRTALAGSVTE